MCICMIGRISLMGSTDFSMAHHCSCVECQALGWVFYTTGCALDCQTGSLLLGGHFSKEQRQDSNLVAQWQQWPSAIASKERGLVGRGHHNVSTACCFITNHPPPPASKDNFISEPRCATKSFFQYFSAGRQPPSFILIM